MLPRTGLSDVFVGREDELAQLRQALAETAAGRGRVVVVVGEAGMGKTRTATELARHGEAAGALVLRGACYDGEWAPPYGPFAEALTDYVREADADLLREEIGVAGAPLTRLAPVLRERFPDLPEPAPLQPDEERFRLFDAVGQFLATVSRRRPVLLVLDDLHWADKGTTALLRHVARIAPRHPFLAVGVYRENEIDAAHPLSDVIAALRRETVFQRVFLPGLGAAETAQLAGAIASRPLSDAMVTSICEHTGGNPFFVRELVQYLVDERKLVEGEALDLPALGVPEGIRHVVRGRLAQLGSDARQLLSVASAFDGSFRFDIAAAVAEIGPETALQAVDEALRFRLVVGTAHGDEYAFSHALIRHTLYAEMIPSRRVRLHRQIAEAIERAVGGRLTESAAEIAVHYHRSKDLDGAERGVPPALAAADRAARAYARDEEAAFLRMALDLLPTADPRRPRLLGRFALALAWVLDFDRALAVARDAARLIAETEDDRCAAQYVAEILKPLWEGSCFRGAFALAEWGLPYAGEQRDATWAALMAMEIIRREAEAAHDAPTRFDTPERRAVSDIVDQLVSAPVPFTDDTVPSYARVFVSATRGAFWHGGDYRRAVKVNRQHAMEWEAQGRLAEAAFCWADAFRFHTALGEFTAAQAARQRCEALVARLPRHLVLMAQLSGADDEWRMAKDEGWEVAPQQPEDGPDITPLLAWFQVAIQSGLAKMFARMGRTDMALMFLTGVVPAMADPPAWMAGAGLVKVACDAAEAAWLTGSADQAGALEIHLFDTVIPANLHHPMTDARLALARLCALQSRYDDAIGWFAKAREVLEAQGARPLRAIVDYDEALMYVRRGADGDAERARLLASAAERQFAALRMPGWLRRVECILRTGREWTLDTPATPNAGNGGDGVILATPDESTPAHLADASPAAEYAWRHNGEYWALTYDGTTVHVRDSIGVRCLARLLAAPNVEQPALVLVADTAATEIPVSADTGPRIDAQARAEYGRRLSELEAEREDAVGAADLGRAERAAAEIEQIEDELSRVLGLGGRVRRDGSPLERARQNVTKAIKKAIARIDAVHPSLGAHLTRAVRTGTQCVYVVEPRAGIRWVVS